MFSRESEWGMATERFYCSSVISMAALSPGCSPHGVRGYLRLTGTNRPTSTRTIVPGFAEFNASSMLPA